MTHPKRQREIQPKFRVTPEERDLIEQKTAQLGTTNMAAYLRKIAIDGMVVNLEPPELKDLFSLLRYAGNKLHLEDWSFIGPVDIRIAPFYIGKKESSTRITGCCSCL